MSNQSNPKQKKTPILFAEDLHKSYGHGENRNPVIQGLHLTVQPGEFLAIMGPSGCGKSTLLHLLGLMSLPDQGRLLIENQEVQPKDRQRTQLRRDKIGFVFQRFNLLGQITGRDNIHVSLKVRGKRPTDHVDRLLKQLDVVDAATRKPGQMSIGQQQRIAVARALAHQPALLLADEPTGNLDSENGRALLKHFRRINKKNQQTIIMITHSADAADYADRVIQMRDGQLME